MMCGKDAGITQGAVPNGTSFSNGTAAGPPFQDAGRSWYPMFFVNGKGAVMRDFNKQGLLRVLNTPLEQAPGLQNSIESPQIWPEGSNLEGPFDVQTLPGLPTRAPPLVIAEAEVAEEEIKLAQPTIVPPALEPWDGVGWEPWSHVARRLQELERAAA